MRYEVQLPCDPFMLVQARGHAARGNTTFRSHLAARRSSLSGGCSLPSASICLRHPSTHNTTRENRVRRHDLWCSSSFSRRITLPLVVVVQRADPPGSICISSRHLHLHTPHLVVAVVVNLSGSVKTPEEEHEEEEDDNDRVHDLVTHVSRQLCHGWQLHRCDASTDAKYQSIDNKYWFKVRDAQVVKCDMHMGVALSRKAYPNGHKIYGDIPNTINCKKGRKEVSLSLRHIEGKGLTAGLVQPWVAQNVTFCFETACNRYISPGSRRRHVSSLSKLFSCSSRSHTLIRSRFRKVILNQGGRHQVAGTFGPYTAP